MEDFYLGHATERIFLPLLKLTIPEIVDYHMPAEGIFHNLVFVSIKKEYPGQAYKVMNALWGQGLMSLAKVLVVVDNWVERAQPAGSVVGGAQQHRPASATRASRWARWTCSTTRAARSRTARRWASTPRANCPRKGSRANGRT